MNIVEHTFSFQGALTRRKSTTLIVLHHAATEKCSVTDVHRWHLANGWSGIGYHFIVRKDGSIHRGRPLDTVGSHTYGENSDSIGICFEGNFETETMSAAQIQAGAELVAYLKWLYPSIKTVGKHKDYCATACPGKNFPFDAIVNGAKNVGKVEAEEETKKGGTTVNITLNVLQNGSEGEQVKNLQCLLIAKGYPLKEYGADGDFGNETEAAVRAFQKANNLDVDGIVGQHSWNKLLKG